MTGLASLAHAAEPRRLLIVQKNYFVARSLARYMKQRFDAVYVAANEAEAEAILKDPVRSPTDLICGQFFGEGHTRGSELVLRWRRNHPTLRRVVLATGSDDVPPCLSGVDAVLLKPGTPAELAALF
jgi:hypothetical protein